MPLPHVQIVHLSSDNYIECTFMYTQKAYRRQDEIPPGESCEYHTSDLVNCFDGKGAERCCKTDKYCTRTAQKQQGVKESTVLRKALSTFLSISFACTAPGQTSVDHTGCKWQWRPSKRAPKAPLSVELNHEPPH